MVKLAWITSFQFGSQTYIQRLRIKPQRAVFNTCQKITNLKLKL